MGTRSNIAYLNNYGEVIIAYCHQDSYLDNNGRILLEHYNDDTLARNLIDHGYMTSLGKTAEECIRKCSDKVETFPHLQCYMAEVDGLSIEFIYLWHFNTNEWHVSYSRSVEQPDAYHRTTGHYHTEFYPLKKELENWDEDNLKRNEVQIL